MLSNAQAGLFAVVIEAQGQPVSNQYIIDRAERYKAWLDQQDAKDQRNTRVG